MRKTALLLLSSLFLAACYTNTKQGNFPEQQLIAPQGAAPATDVKTTAADVLAKEQNRPNAQAKTDTPAPSVPAAALPSATQTTQEPAAASASALQPLAKTPAENNKQTATPSATAAGPAPAAKAPAQAVFTPAPDKAVFEGEELIDLQGRRLHPYAALVPDESLKQTAPWAGEQLKYGIYYTFIKAGTAYIRNRGLVSIDGRPAYLLQTSAFSAPVIDAFFKVRDINFSWLDAQDFYSRGYGQSVREGGYKRDEWVTFDYKNKKYTGEIQKKEAPRPINGPLNIKVLDMLTSLYYVRAQQLTPGKDIVFDIINREKQYPLVVNVLGKETVKTDAGTFDCIVVEPQIRGEGIFVSKGKSLKVWLTDDQYKMPVKMQVEVFIGSVSAKLLDYKRQASPNIL